MQVSNWMLVNQKILPIGLDIGQGSVKIVQMALAGDHVKILAAGRAPLDAGLACDGPDRQKAVVLAVKHLLSEGDFRGRNVISALPLDQLKMTSVRLPEAESGEAEEAIRQEAADRFGLDLRKDAINYILAGAVHQGDELKNEYILLAADSAGISSHIASLEEMGLTPVGLDAAPCALFRAFERMMRRQEDKEKTIIVLDVGCRHTIVVFGRAGEICFAKHIPTGMCHFNEEIASTLGIAAGDAELLRRKLQRDEPIEAAFAPSPPGSDHDLAAAVQALETVQDRVLHQRLQDHR